MFSYISAGRDSTFRSCVQVVLGDTPLFFMFLTFFMFYIIVRHETKGFKLFSVPMTLVFSVRREVTAIRVVAKRGP